jgi:hypothetical protein
MGLYCHKWWWPQSRGKHIYFQHQLTNFDSRIPCNSGEYKSGALCYRDCGKNSMTNCGIGACAMNDAACASGVANIVVDVLSGLIEGALFIASFGSSSGMSAGISATTTAVKSIGKSTLKTMARGVKNWMKKTSIAKFR